MCVGERSGGRGPVTVILGCFAKTCVRACFSVRETEGSGWGYVCVRVGVWEAVRWCMGVWEAVRRCMGVWEAVRWCMGVWEAVRWCMGVWEAVRWCMHMKGDRMRIVIILVSII